MSVIIRPMRALKSFFNNQSEITVEAGCTVRETLAALNIKSEIIAGVFVNGEMQSKDYLLQENDEVKLFAVMSGG